MSYAKQMLDTYPRDFNVDVGVLAAAIQALSDGAQACTACADDCLSERGRADQVHPLVPGLRGCLHGHPAGGQPSD